MSRSRPTRALLALLCASLLVVSLGAPGLVLAEDPTLYYAIPTFPVNGGGWGHSIGMSQYGAEGFSTVLGWDADRIMGHYFQGTTIRTLASLGKQPNPVVKVNIDSAYSGSYAGRSYWNLRGFGGRLLLSDGDKSVYLAADTSHTLRGSGGDVYVDEDKDGQYDSGEERFDGTVKVNGQGGARSLAVWDESGPYDLTRLVYRGSMNLSVASGSTWRLQAVNRVRLEDYLYGVVPREMPSSWSAEALKAQSIAARSYAWASNPPSSSKPDELSGTLHCTAASQVYGASGRVSGDVLVEHETARAEVQATAGEVVYYAPTSTVVQTFFSSSSGGYTANIEDVWTSSSPKPYYTGVSDAYDYVRSNPYASWTRSFTGLQLAGRLAASSYTWAPPGAGSSVWVKSVSVERGPSGYPRWTTFTFSTNATTKESAWDVRQALSLPSPNFQFAAVPVDRIDGPDRYATAVEIADRAFPGTAPSVVIARGDEFADALVGSAVAGAAGGPLLLATPGGFTSETRSKLRDLDPDTIYIMGSEDAVSPGIEEVIEQRHPDATIVRISGRDRYATAAKAAAVVDSLGGGSKAILASGTSWPDAAAASALAWAKGYPILLTQRASLPSKTRDALAALAPTNLLVVGGDSVIAPSVRTAAKNAAGGSLRRLYGSDRYGTSAAVARHAVEREGFSASTLYLATGEIYVDALTGGTLAGVEMHPLALTMSDRIKPGTESLLAEWRNDIDKLGVFGGPASVQAKALDEAQMILAD